MNQASGRIVVVGEAVADLITLPDGLIRPVPGGSPPNVAVALNRLEVPVRLLVRLGDDAFGRMIGDHLRGEGLDPEGLVHTEMPSTLALVTTDETGHPTYDFWTEGTSDWGWTTDDLLGRIPPDTRCFHLGSVASWTRPGSEALIEAAQTLRRSGVTVTFDPNVRPSLMGDADYVRSAIDRLVAAADLVKVSDEDLAWLAPGAEPVDVAKKWLGMGAGAVVVTRGSAGALAVAQDFEVVRAARPIQVVDTVGAGDTFMAGLLYGLAGRAAEDLSADDWALVLDTAIAAAGVTCSRRGCNPPNPTELAAALAG